MKGVFAFIGKLTILVFSIGLTGYVLVRCVVKDPPRVENFGRFEVNGAPVVNLIQVFSAPGASGFAPEPNWVPTDWDAKLAHPLTFVDPNDLRWEVPAGQINDGASVPLILHSFVGGGHNGLFLGAAIVHDCYCQKEEARTSLNVDWPEVHKMFYYAMRASNVPEARAKVMYGAVACFGPPRSMEQWIRLLAEWDSHNGAAARAAKTDWIGWGGAEDLKQQIDKENRDVAEAEATRAMINPEIARIETEVARIGDRSSKLSSPFLAPVSGIRIERASEADQLRLEFESKRREVVNLQMKRQNLDAAVEASAARVEGLTQELKREEAVQERANALLSKIERNASSLTLEDIEVLTREVSTTVDWNSASPPE